MLEAEAILRSAYRAFNARDLDAALELMHPDVVSMDVIDPSTTSSEGD
jgi:ketosteroid isomerase-like protein